MSDAPEWQALRDFAVGPIAKDGHNERSVARAAGLHWALSEAGLALLKPCCEELDPLPHPWQALTCWSCNREPELDYAHVSRWTEFTREELHEWLTELTPLDPFEQAILANEILADFILWLEAKGYAACMLWKLP